MNKNYLKCKSGDHKLVVSWYQRNILYKQCHCGKNTKKVFKNG